MAAFCRIGGLRLLDVGDQRMEDCKTYLSTVDELGQGDISAVAEGVDVLPEARGTVLEPEADKVTDIRRRAAAELNGEGRGVVG